MYIYIYIERERDKYNRNESNRTGSFLRPFFILRIVRPIIFESKFRNHCAKKLDGALRKPTSFVKEFV